MIQSATSILVGLLLLGIPAHSSAFVQPRTVQTIRSSVSTSRLQIGNLFGGLFGQDDGSASKDGPAKVIELPADTVKVNPLKFFLQIFLVSELNKPVKGSWVLNENEENRSLDMYYKDGSGMFAIVLNETGIQINRYGERPSLQYMLQESVKIHGILDELDQIAFGVDDIEREKRLLQFATDDAISKVRENLPARKEE